MIVEHGAICFCTLFISDVHLGARGCRAGRLFDFLRFGGIEAVETAIRQSADGRLEIIPRAGDERAVKRRPAVPDVAVADPADIAA